VVLLEGLEVVFIVIAVGSGRGLPDRAPVHVGGSAGRHHVNDLTRRRVVDLIRLAGRGLGPLAFDDHRRHSCGTPLRLDFVNS